MKNIKEREREFHNNRYLDNNRKWLSNVYVFAKSSKTFFSNMVTNIRSGDNVLEIGCGITSINKNVAEIGANVTIIDISEKAIEITKRKLINDKLNISCMVMDAENLTFNNNSFDLVYGSGILHHLNIEKAITEINRVLKNGGKAIFYEPLGHNILVNLFRGITPSLRTEDEHPLLKEDLRVIKRFFPKTKFYYFYLFSLFCIPFNKISSFERLSNMIERLDKYLNQVFPWLQKYNWITIIEIEK